MSRFHSRRKLRTALMLLGILVVLSVRVSAQPAESFQQAWRSGVPFEVSGVVRVIYADDFQNHRAEVIHTIRDERTGHEFRLRFEHEAPALQTGRRVALRGRTRGSEIYLNAQESNEVVVQALDPSAPLQVSAGSTSQANVVTGDQSTLVIVANFQDKTLDPLRPGADCSIQAISDRMFTDPNDQSVDDLYRAISFGQVSFSGRIVGPVTLNASSTDACNNNVWADAADGLAAATGIDVSQYARKLYVMPTNMCPAAGLGELAVTPSRAWVFTCDIPHVYAHELGHNLGMDHAATPTTEYGDDSDVMGSQGGLKPVNAPHKRQMGWLGDAQTLEVTQTGTYAIAPLPLDAALVSAPQTLKIRKPDSNDYYYVSFRNGDGFEANACCSYLDRISVHRWSGMGKTYLLATLEDGQTYADPSNGFSVTHENHTASLATTRISVATSCGATAPSLSLTPRDQSGAAGIGVSYDVVLANDDGASCNAGAFALSRTVPSGWASLLTPATLTLTPGAIGHALLTVTPPLAAPSGAQSLSVTASDGNVAEHNASTTGSYTVVRTCSTSPVVGFTPANQSAPPGVKLRYSLSLVSRDDAGCPPTSVSVVPAVPASWVATVSPPAVSLSPGASAVVTYDVTSATGSGAGSYPIWANVADNTGGHAASAAGSYAVDTRDLTPPSAPATLVGVLRRGQVTLSWQLSTDNVGVAGYRVTRDGVVVALVTGTGWVDTTVQSGATYTYSVTAYDNTSNVSAASNLVTIKTSTNKRK